MKKQDYDIGLKKWLSKLGTLTTLAKDPGSILNTHMVVYNHLQLQSQEI